MHPEPVSPRRLLVTGASGFIGRHLIASGPQLARELGITVVAASADADLRDPVVAQRLMDDSAPDCVAHLAALSFVPDSFARPWDTFEVNLRGTLNLLEAASRRSLAGPFLFISTADVYGVVAEQELPLCEDRRFTPRSPYGVTKAAGEILCLQHAAASKLDVRIARPFNIIGPGQDSRFAVSSFARQIAQLERSTESKIHVGNLDVTRDFVDVRDAVAAFMAILRAGRCGEAYNVCSGRETILRTLLERLVSRAHKAIEIVVEPARVRPAEQRRVVGSFEKLRQHTGWEPAVELDATLDDVLEQWRATEAGIR